MFLSRIEDLDNHYETKNNYLDLKLNYQNRFELKLKEVQEMMTNEQYDLNDIE